MDIYTKIYRVICTDQYHHSEPETKWHMSKEYCEKYIARSSYKHCLHIETEELVVDD